MDFSKIFAFHLWQALFILVISRLIRCYHRVITLEVLTLVKHHVVHVLLGCHHKNKQFLSEKLIPLYPPLLKIPNFKGVSPPRFSNLQSPVWVQTPVNP